MAQPKNIMDKSIQEMESPQDPLPPPYSPAQALPDIYVRAGLHGESDTIVLMDPECGFSEKAVRHSFIRKVYGILMCQLLVTMGIIALFCFHQPTNYFARTNTIFVMATYIFALIVYIVIICSGALRRLWPWNLIFLGVFTVAMSLFLGVVASFHDVKEVFIAVGFTTVICLGITIFAFQTKWDFTMWGGLLYVALIVLLLTSLVFVFVDIEVLNLVLCGFGTLLFSAYLVYDTQLLIGEGHQLAISPEEYIFAALMLYIDIIQILRYMLRFMR